MRFSETCWTECCSRESPRRRDSAVATVEMLKTGHACISTLDAHRDVTNRKLGHIV